MSPRGSDVIVQGVDGCKGGWVVASARADLTRLDLKFVRSLDQVLDAAQPPAVVAVDMPIGLPSCSARPCDLEARKLLGKRKSSSVFPAPCRAALEAASKPCPLCGKKLSTQARGILSKVKELDELLEPETQSFVSEAHPEVTFAALANPGKTVPELMRVGAGLASKKQRAVGQEERMRLLTAFGLPSVEPRMEAKRLRTRDRGPKSDDIVDALACLITAQRAFRKECLVLPHTGICVDARGLKMEIVA